MTVPSIAGVQLGGSADLPLLLCGPSLGTSATALWSTTADLLSAEFHVVAWDLPGHGYNNAASEGGFTLGELADGVLAFIEGVLTERGEPAGSFVYAGDSVGGAVGQQLMLDHPERIRAAVLACSVPRFADAAMWHERAEKVRTSGTPVMVEGSARRWFGPGFLDRQPDLAAALLHSLQETDRFGYAAVCDALADFDIRSELHRITTPMTAIAGAYDEAAPVAGVAALAHGVADGRLVVLDRVGHQAPVEASEEMARAIRHAAGIPVSPKTLAGRMDAGMAVRRDVLGAAHVDRANAAATDLTRDFQSFITDYGWGGIWTRPGLARRDRSIAVLTALVARGHHEELAMHLRAARTNGLTVDEIKEVLLQSAIYCGVPDANTAFRIAQEVLEQTD
ncbi:4-carboxymuconolactone decarboxylase [Flexivirga alba]|uniref:4-carboxymuconolactone decarboxylase n=1 Tax=Flexivirga alba TaxID=702742 RepID=A0ABW2AIS2_9MICO